LGVIWGIGGGKSGGWGRRLQKPEKTGVYGR
jgi:hypothetical protein